MEKLTPRQNLINLVAARLIAEGHTLPSRETVLQTSLEVGQALFDAEPSAPVPPECDYFDGLQGKALSRYANDVIAEIGLIFTDESRLQAICAKLPAAALLQLADSAFITPSGVIELWHGGGAFGSVMLGQWLLGAIGQQLRLNVEEWIPNETLRDEGNGDYVFAATKPKHWVELYSLEITNDITQAALVLAEATHAVILNPSQDVILYKVTPESSLLSNGIPLAYIPQTFDGKAWPKVYEYARKLEFDDQSQHLKTSVVHRIRRAVPSRENRTLPEWAMRALLVDDAGKPLDFESMPANLAAVYTEVANVLYTKRYWSGADLLHVDNPFLVYERMKRNNEKQVLGVTAPNENALLAGLQHGWGDDGIVHIRPYIARDFEGEHTNKAWVVAHSLQDSGRWHWVSDLIVHDSPMAASLLLAGAIKPEEIALIANNLGQYHARLNLIPVESDALAVISKRLIIASGHLLALACGFNPTRIASTGAKALIATWGKIFDYSLSQANPAHYNNRDLAVLQQIIAQVFDEATLRELLPAIKEAAFYAEELQKQKQDTWVAFVWDVMGKLTNVQAAQANHDLEHEIISVCAWDVAKAGGFNTAWIAAKTEQVTRRQMIVTLQEAPNSPHWAHWQGLNESDRLLLVRATRARAGMYRQNQPRPKYLEAIVQQS